jgi:hypothetical protein
MREADLLKDLADPVALARRLVAIEPSEQREVLGLTRSRGHLLKGGYDVGYGIKHQDETDTTAVHGGV